MDYLQRIIDNQFSLLMDAFGAVLIVGPKGCGKTTSAKQKAHSVIEFQDEENRDNYLMLAENRPTRLLAGEKPILFDEWQDAPKIWGAIRKDVDDSGETGQYILTGSTSQTVQTPHTGTLRIARMKMYPMSLYESGDSNGTISLMDLFNNESIDDHGWESCLSIEDLIFAICRGGWPRAVTNRKSASKLIVAKTLFSQTVQTDISNVDKVKRNPLWAEAILRSYARNICQLTEVKSIYKDAKTETNMAESTFFDYLEALAKRTYACEQSESYCVLQEKVTKSGHGFSGRCRRRIMRCCLKETQMGTGDNNLYPFGKGLSDFCHLTGFFRGFHRGEGVRMQNCCSRI